MRGIVGILAVLMALVLLAGAVLLIGGAKIYTAPGPLTSPQFFIVEKGSGVGSIARNLLRAGAVADETSVLVFRAAARFTGYQSSLKAGEYEIPSGASIRDILEKMARGDIFRRQFTIPEGRTSWQIVQILNATENLDGALTDIPLEGSLLPETYQYVKGERREDKIRQMQEAMTRAMAELWPTRAANIVVLSEREALILASIVEKETGVASERARIAGVFINRLRLGMPLQTDPTVIYALTSGKIEEEGQGPLGRRLLRKDLEVDSLYNTYKYPGLPPGPICNPGRDAIAAVLQPEAHDYLYFVADGTGGHVFARTLAEHNENVAEWRKIRAAAP